MILRRVITSVVSIVMLSSVFCFTPRASASPADSQDDVAMAAFSTSNTSSDQSQNIEVNHQYSYSVKYSLNMSYTYWYKFTLNKPGYIHISLSDSEGDKSRWHYQILADDAQKTDISHADQVGLAKGQYFLTVNTDSLNLLNSKNLGDTVAFSLNVGYIPAANWEAEPNDSFWKADGIKLGSRLYGTFGLHYTDDTGFFTDQEEDYFSFSLPKALPIQFIINNEVPSTGGEGNKFDVSLLDSAYKQIAKYSWNAASSTHSSAKLNLGKGQYYLKLSPNLDWSHKSISYNFVVNDVTPVPVSVYRVYNKHSGLHHYTKDSKEYRTLVSLGWNDERAAFKAFDQAASGSIPVYREYNPHDGNHNWTKDKHEHDVLVSRGWRDEGTAWWVPSSGGNVTVYRLYNPHSGEHVYTTDQGEYAKVGRAGWHQEGVAWKAYKA